MLSWPWLLVLSLVACAAAEKVRYDDYRVYRVVPATQQQLVFIAGLQAKFEKLDFWREVSRVNRSVDIMMAPSEQERFLQALEGQGIGFSVFIENVQKLIDDERPKGDRQKAGGMTWDNYYDLEAVYKWMDNMTATYPTVATSVVGGKTYEGREIRGVRVSYKEGNPAVVIEAGIHAREWITVAFATYFINELLTSEDTAIRNIADSFDFYIFPSTNPDGYEYSWTTDRVWRKTRTAYPPCYGADPNRNWDFHWGDETSNPFLHIPCWDAYAGPEAFSEVETRTLSQFLKGLGDKLQVYLSFHCYSQMLMFPYGLKSVVADNYDELLKIATKAADVLSRRYGTEYQVGSVVDTIYPSSGLSIDWVMDALKLKYVFVWELRDKLERGFELPAEQIIPTCEETTDSVLSVLQDVLAATRGQANQ